MAILKIHQRALAVVLIWGVFAATGYAEDVPGGAYTLDKSHSSLILRADHLGFSFYTARFTTFDAKLQFDPGKPQEASVTVTIDPNSLAIDNGPDGFIDQLRGPKWLDTAKFPEMSFRSTKVERTGDKTLRILGELTMHGVTKPMTLEATYNGGYARHPYEPRARIGFSARGVFKRSEFGISYGIPEAGSKMGVSDEVEVIVETEFSGKEWQQKPQA